MIWKQSQEFGEGAHDNVALQIEKLIINSVQEKVDGVPPEVLDKLYARQLKQQQDLLKSMGKDPREIDLTQIEQQLQQEAENYCALKVQIDQMSGDDPESQRLKAEAEAAMEAGDFDRAHESLLARRRHRQNAAKDFLRADAENCAALAASDKLRDFSAAGYQRAADYYAEAAQRVADIDPATAREYRRQQARTLNELGALWGDLEALQQAEAIYQDVLKSVAAGADAEEWAKTQNNLGNVLLMLGERENDPAQLRASVKAYRAALQVRTKNKTPLDWAATQNNLGNVLQTLGERENDPEQLRASVKAYRAALQVRTKDKTPLKWAMTQNNLGIVLRTLGDHENDPEQLRESVKAHRAALQVRTKDKTPLGWAMTQNNLGAVLSTLGEREKSLPPLREAVAVQEAALPIMQSVPAYAQMAQNNLAQSRAALLQLEAGLGRTDDK